jgi:hypothetical protein
MDTKKGCSFCCGSDKLQPNRTTCEMHAKLVCEHGELFLAYCEECQDTVAAALFSARAGQRIEVAEVQRT